MRVLFTTVGPQLPSGDDLPYSFRYQYQSALALGDGTGIHAGSPEFAIVDELRPGPEELIIHKVSRSAFAATGLENILRNIGIDQLVIGGGATHACVESTGRAASDLGFQVAVVDDACISQFPLLHDATMINFHMSMGRVVTTPGGRRRNRSRVGAFLTNPRYGRRAVANEMLARRRPV